MRRFAFIALLGIVAAPLACGDPRPDPAAVAPTPVLIELYTSEGCSSCPPADRLLTELTAEQPIAGAEVIALGEHVDYWDSLGWRDRFSSHAFTARQSESQRKAFGSSTIYTPQIVVDGVHEAVGSDRAAVRDAIAQAARTPKGEVRLTTAAPENDIAPVTIRLDLHAAGSHALADILVAVVEDDLTTDVTRGENRGRTLTHNAVVRRLSVVGALDAGKAVAELTTGVRLDPDWRIKNLRIVAFVQERQSRRVRGVASATIAPDPRPRNAEESRSRRPI